MTIDVTGVINDKFHRAFTKTIRKTDTEGNPYFITEYYYSIEGEDTQKLTESDFFTKKNHLEKHG